MNYVLIENDQTVYLGPIEWNSAMFQHVLKSELNIITNIPIKNTDNIVFDVNGTIKIRPANYVYPEAHNPKIQQFAGPVWNIEVGTGIAIGTFTNVDKTVESVKNSLKSEIAENRWTYETGGIIVTVQGQSVSVTTKRGDRDIFLQALQQTDLNGTRLWKFNDIWLTLTYSDLELIVNSIINHIQTAFAWEQQKIIEIEAANTLPQLDGINLQVV